jgi:hypothetical protein
MSTFDLYTLDPETSAWAVPAAGDARFTWQYDDGRDRLLSLYQRGKDRQWDATTRIDWSVDLDPEDPFGMPKESHPLAGSATYERMSQRERDESGTHVGVWQFSQFLHGEQGALLCSARIVESVPDLDSKYYAATQVMDEARHVEAYSRLLQDKVGMLYPINPYLKALLDDTLTDSRWDFPYLGMQVLIEGLALAAFGVFRDMTVSPLVKQVLAYVMADEARHVAFGRLALRDYYAQLTSAELADREEFVIEGCHLMRNRFRGEEVWENLGYDRKDCLEAIEHSESMRLFRTLLFSRIVPCVKDIGLWSPAVRQAYADMGVLDMAGLDLDELMRDDEDKADEQDRARRDAARFEADYAVRRGEVDAAVAAGSD